MRRFLPAIFVALLPLVPASAGDDGLTGFWKFSVYQAGNPTPFWLVRLDSKDGKLTASAEPLRDGPQAKIESVKQTGDTFQMTIRATFVVEGEKRFAMCEYEGKLPKPGAKKILGSMSLGKSTFPAVLEATPLKSAFEVEMDMVRRTPTDPRAMSAVFEVIEAAQDKKLDAKDLQEIVDTSLKASEAFGPRYQSSHGLRLLSALSEEKGYGTVTVETARKIAKEVDPKSRSALVTIATIAEILRRAKLKEEANAIAIEAANRFVKQLDEKASAASQIRTLLGAAELLRESDKKAEAVALEARIDKLEDAAFAEHDGGKEALNFKVEKFAGRKGASKRVVLVELFTGAMCPPCVAADMAFDGLQKAYSDKEVVLLQYHMHIPRPDPMNNADCNARFEYYADSYRKFVRGTPAILFNGKPEAPGGGSSDEAAEKYGEYCKVVNKLLETPANIRLEASATRTGDKISIAAKVIGPDKADDKLRLRLVLVEDWVRFTGSNGLQYHHRVVRAMPGGIKGYAVKAKETEQKAAIDLAELRQKLGKYLDDDYPADAPRPMRLRNLHVVALVQNDDTTEVLQALDVPVREEK